MLLHDLTIENFRSFEKYKLDKLARVNLLVGDNNCGKTSVLEAAYLLVAKGLPEAIIRTLNERGDFQYVDDPYQPNHRFVAARLKSIFSSRNGSNSRVRKLTISSGNDQELTLLLGDVLDLQKEVPQNSSLSGVGLNHFIGMCLISDYRGLDNSSQIRGLTKEGFLRPFDPSLSGTDTGGVDLLDESRVVFISTREVTAGQLKSAWSLAQATDQEDDIAEQLRVIVPNLSQIKVQPIEAPQGSKAVILLQESGESRPISEYGEGTYRLLALGVSFHTLPGGTILIDEIDTGLHYSRLADMWKMVITAAKKLDVQVFATTHSLDCIRGLGEAVYQDESFVDDVAIFKIDRRMNEAARYSGDELEVIVDHQIEVR